MNPQASRSETSDTLDMGAPDAVLRAQLRLGDLGYLSSPLSGRADAAYRAALDAYQKNAGSAALGVPAALFDNAAPAAIPADEAAVLTRPAQTMLFGAPMAWEEVRQKLVMGESYTVTDCYSGIVLRLVYDGGDGHAHMRPALAWDAATLQGLAGDINNFEKQPVVIGVDGVRVAASIDVHAHTEDGELANAYFCTYFFGSVSSLGGIEDADHNAALNIAAGRR